MFDRLSSRVVIVTVMLVVLLGLATSVMAQDSGVAGSIEVVGQIELVSTTSIMVNGLTMNLTGAEVKTALTLHALVEVEGNFQPDGTVQVREVRAAAGDLLPGELEIVGVLDLLTSDTAMVNGVMLRLLGTEIYPGVAQGATVKVHAMLADNGMWTAREVQLFVPGMDGNTGTGQTNPVVTTGGEFEITGTLDQVGDGFIVVSGRQISIVGAEIKNQLVAGVLVKVHVSLVDGQIRAREVENAQLRFGDDDDQESSRQGSEVEFTGLLQEVGQGFMVISGRTVDTRGAEIKGALSAGMMVKVHASNQNGALIAREVEAARGDDDEGFNVSSDCVAQQPAGWNSYTVQQGDTLFSIALRSNSRVRELARVNCLQDARFLAVGAQVFVPGPLAPADSVSMDDDDDQRGRNDDRDDDHSNDDSRSGSGSDDDRSGHDSDDSDDSDDSHKSDDSRHSDNSGSGSRDRDDD